MSPSHDALAWTALTAARSWCGPGRSRRRHHRTRSSPSSVISRSQRVRSWSASTITSPSEPIWAGRRAAVRSMSASRPRTSGSSGSSWPRTRPRWIASSTRSRRSEPSSTARRWPSLNTRATTASTCGSRIVSSSRVGERTTTLPARSLRLARTIRCVIVSSDTRKASAIDDVSRPATRRSVSAICACGASAGWQVVMMRPSTSSTGGWSGSVSERPSLPDLSSDSCRYFAARLDSRRSRSTARRRATAVSHAPGRSGTPDARHEVTASAKASCAHSSARSRSPYACARVATTRRHSSRNAVSIGDTDPTTAEESSGERLTPGCCGRRVGPRSGRSSPPTCAPPTAAPRRGPRRRSR